MKISAQFMPGDLPVFVESVRKAEEGGYARAYLVDGQLLWRNVFVYMTLGLDATERIPFGTAVTNPYTRHPSVLANAHATLEEIYPGRVILGIGRGDNSVRTLGKKQVATDRMRDIVPMIRDLMAGKEVDVDGHEARILWASEADVPILMAASGPRNLRLAGALADIVMMQVGVNPKPADGGSSRCERAPRRRAATPPRSRSRCTRRWSCPTTSTTRAARRNGPRRAPGTTSSTSRGGCRTTGCRSRSCAS